MNAAEQGSSSSATPDTSADTDAGDEVVDVVGDTTEGTPGTNEQQESNVVGSTGGVVAVSPKPLYNTNGKLLEVDAATHRVLEHPPVLYRIILYRQLTIPYIHRGSVSSPVQYRIILCVLYIPRTVQNSSVCSVTAPVQYRIVL